MTFLQDLIVSGLPISILVVAIGKRLFSNQSFQRSIIWLRWILIASGVSNLIYFLYIFAFDQAENQWLQRMHSEYQIAYGLLIFSNTLLPLLLFWKRIHTSISMLFVIAILMNLGSIFESFVTITTSFQRDYSTVYPIRELFTVAKGFLIGIVILSLDVLTQYLNVKPSKANNSTK